MTASQDSGSAGANLFAGLHDGSKFDCGTYFGPDEFDAMLAWGSDRKASDVTLQPNIPAMADIGGLIIPITTKPLTSAEIEGIVRYVYGENGPAEIMGGSDLDPSHEIRIRGLGVKRYRVNVTGGRIIGGKGMQMTIRSLPGIPPLIDDLDIEPEIIANCRPEQGLILVTGPTGSGKSTLLSSVIRMLIERPNGNEKVLEYSAPIEYIYDGVKMPSSVVFQTHAGRDLRPRGASDEHSIFAYCVRNGLRRKPTIIVIGEARDKATIEATVEAGLTGHLVFSTMHTIGVGETLRRATMPFPDDVRRSMAVDIMESLRMVVTQLLVPKVGGGKVACREFMVFGRDIREAFLKENVDAWPKVSRRLLAEERAIGRTMAKSALNLLARGLIDEHTYERIAARGRGT
jgi:defect-in-organelle-trafficking protein DotB